MILNVYCVTAYLNYLANKIMGYQILLLISLDGKRGCTIDAQEQCSFICLLGR